ncbi:MAG: Tad domain-containing protein, partial [Acidobacteriia bacterium]|nr:Tad domain-containing protein [Terriglobia bacterium]
MSRMQGKAHTRLGRYDDRGQTTILVVIALALFLMGFVGFAVDMTNMWFHRQMAQGAADAACQAGIMNVLVPTATQHFTPGTDFTCTAGSLATPCRYAALNGYNGAGLAPNAPSNSVAVSFPGSPPTGVDPSVLPPTTLSPHNFLRVDIVDRVKMTFATLITRQPTSDVHAQAICGLTLSRAPVPIIVLNPTCEHPFEVSGSTSLTIVGGPTRSAQVNSLN